MLNAVVEQANTWLNQFPESDGIPADLSPSAIVLGIPKPDCAKLKISFGSYAQVFDSTDNTMHKRSIPAIALKPSNNQGGYYFMSLNTGRQIHSYQWTELPVTDHVIQRVHSMTTKQNQPKLVDQTKYFEWRPDSPIMDEVNMQDGNEEINDEEHGEDPFEYDGYSDDSEMFDTWSHEWRDTNDGGFESDDTFENMDETRLNPTDDGHYHYNSDECTRELLSHDPNNIFQEAEATAADVEKNQEQIQPDDNDGDDDNNDGHDPRNDNDNDNGDIKNEDSENEDLSKGNDNQDQNNDENENERDKQHEQEGHNANATENENHNVADEIDTTEEETKINEPRCLMHFYSLNLKT